MDEAYALVQRIKLLLSLKGYVEYMLRTVDAHKLFLRKIIKATSAT